MNEFVAVVISISLMGSIAAIVTMLLKAVISGKLSARVDLYIWMPVILRLIIPYIPRTRMSVYNHIPQAARIYAPASIEANGSAFAHTYEINLLPAIWICGAAVAALISVVSYCKFLKSIKCSRTNYGHINQIAQRAKKLCNFKGKLCITVCKNNISPMIVGFIRPKLLIPELILESFSEKQLDIVFVHELMHLKRKDRFLNALLVIISCVHWFNPVIWITASRIKKDNENACDELAVKTINESEKYMYSKTLIDLAECFCSVKASRCVSPMASEKNTLKNRITKIYNISKKKFSIIALPLCVITSVTFLTGAVSSEATKIADSVVKEIEPLVTVTASKTEPITELQQENVPGSESAETADGIEAGNKDTNDSSDAVVEDKSDDYQPAGKGNPNPESEVPPKNNTAAPEDGVSTNVPPLHNTQDNRNNQSSQSTQSSALPSEGKSDEKTYTYRSSNAQVSLSNDPSNSGFACDTGDLKIETVGILTSTDDSLRGYFNIYKDGELAAQNVRATVTASPSSIRFNDEHSSDNDFSFSVHTKTIS